MFTFKEIYDALSDSSDLSLNESHAMDYYSVDADILVTYQTVYNSPTVAGGADIPEWAKGQHDKLVIVHTNSLFDDQHGTPIARLHSIVAMFEGMNVEVRYDHSRRYINVYHTKTKHGITHFAAKRNLFLAVNDGAWRNSYTSLNQWHKFVASKILDMTRGKLIR